MVIITVPLLFLLTLLSGVCPMTPKEYYVKAGDMVALHCEGKNNDDAQVLWKSDSSQEMYLYNNISAAEQRQMGVVVYGDSLVILSASENHQGNYSCFLRSHQSLFRLTVYRTQSREYDETTQHPQTCYTSESCIMKCPDVLCVHTLNITRNGTTWYKNKSSPSNYYFEIVNKNDSGNYTCIKHYLYHGQIYNETLNMVLDVQPNKKEQKHAVIASPREGEVFDVELGSTKVIDCVAETFSCNHTHFWFIEPGSFVAATESSRVFYKETCNDDSKKMTASLVFKEVLKEDLSKQYRCILQSDNQYPKSVNITLTQKARPSYVSLASCFISMVVVMVVTVAVYVKFKVDIFLYLRDTLNCRWSAAEDVKEVTELVVVYLDEKSYDAYLMCYESVTDGGLNVCDRRWLENVLEERFGYHLCLYERDVLPGKAAAEAVLDCIEQSRTVVLVPTSADPAPGSGLLSAIHAALVERQTRLVFINTEMTQVSRSGSLLEALQILSEVGDCVTWKGSSSMSPSSSFWKQLRYYLPAPQK